MSSSSNAKETLSEYEELRLAHMRRNHEYLVALGLKRAEDPIAPNHAPGPRPTKRRAIAKKAPADPSLCRRSARLAGKDVEYGETTLTDLDERDELRLEGEGPPVVRGSLGADRAEMREATMAFLRQVREAALPVVYEDDWQKEAVRRWGEGCVAPRGDWKTFVASRLSTPPPVSPLDFLQEYYAADTWRLLVSCVLMSRVSSWTVKHTCIANFFERYATPTAFADETTWGDVRALINPLGLFDDRLKSLVALTDAFLRGGHSEDDDEFQLATDRNSKYKVHGIGPFAVDSFLVFCKDMGPHITLSAGGKPVEPFVQWRKKEARRLPGPGRPGGETNEL